MDLMELGAIGELLGAVAVVGSLVYVGLQIQRNTIATRAASRHAITDSFNELNLSFGRDLAVAGVFRRGFSDRESLTEDERFQFDMLCLSAFRVHETLFYNSRVGTAERSLLVAEQRSLRSSVALPGIRDWWANNPYSFEPEFVDYVDSFISESVPAERGA